MARAHDHLPRQKSTSLCDREHTANIASKLIGHSARVSVPVPSRSAHRVTRAVRRQRRGAIRDSMSVQEYIDKHELTKVVEDAVNAAVKVKPDEPLSFLVRAIEPVHLSIFARYHACVSPPVWSTAKEARLGCVAHAGRLGTATQTTPD